MAAILPVTRDALAGHVDDLLRLLFECEADLPNASNGRPVPWTDKYAENVYKDIRYKQTAEVRRLLAVLLGFIARGSKTPRVRLFTQRLDAIVQRFGQNAEPRPIRILNRRETREDAFMDMAQMRLEADTDDADALEALVRQIGFYEASLNELKEAALDRLVALRAGREPRPIALVSSTATDAGSSVGVSRRRYRTRKEEPQHG